jgi:hypothetical protein
MFAAPAAGRYSGTFDISQYLQNRFLLIWLAEEGYQT